MTMLFDLPRKLHVWAADFLGNLHSQKKAVDQRKTCRSFSLTRTPQSDPVTAAPIMRTDVH